MAVAAKPEVEIWRWPKKSTFWPWFPIHFFRHFFARTYRFATIQNVTDRQTTDRQTKGTTDSTVGQKPVSPRRLKYQSRKSVYVDDLYRCYWKRCIPFLQKHLHRSDPSTDKYNYFCYFSSISTKFGIAAGVADIITRAKFLGDRLRDVDSVVGGGSKIATSHWQNRSPLNRTDATVQHVIVHKVHM